MHLPDQVIHTFCLTFVTVHMHSAPFAFPHYPPPFLLASHSPSSLHHIQAPLAWPHKRRHVFTPFHSSPLYMSLKCSKQFCGWVFAPTPAGDLPLDPHPVVYRLVPSVLYTKGQPPSLEKFWICHSTTTQIHCWLYSRIKLQAYSNCKQFKLL